MFKVGDKVKQYRGQYGTTRIGWTGIVTDVRTSSITVQWKEFPGSALSVYITDVKKIGPSNKPDVSRKGE